MSWVQISDADALPAGSNERISIVAIKGVDDLADIVLESVETFRDAIRSSGQQLGPDGTIALGLKQYVLDRAVWIFLSRGVAKNEGIQTKARSDAADRAEKILDKIIDGTFKVISDDPNATISHGVETVRRGRRLRTNSFDKISET